MHTATAEPVPFDDRAEFDQALDRATAAGKAYYDGEHPLMSDQDYDTLVASIAASKRQHPDWHTRGITTAVAPGSAGGTVRHAPPMLSLDKAASPADMRLFVSNMSTSLVVVELKLDGMAVRATYRDGRLHQASTRGDGTTGDDITAHITRGSVAGLPVNLENSAWTGEVRGELFLSDQDFEDANNARVVLGKKPFVNSRNAVAGTIRKLDPEYPTSMSFAAYAIAGDDLHDLDSHQERMAFAKALGFATTYSMTLAALPSGTPISFRQPEQVTALIDTIGECRALLPFPIDGVVVKVDSRAVRRRMGTSSRAPRWGKAAKFPPDTGFSTLRDIEVSVGRTGQASFRAVIDPVFVSGVTVSAATLHNVAWIQEQQLGVGSRVSVMRRGDVIPRVTAAAGEQPADVVPWTPPPTCPKCGQFWDTSSQLWRCATPACALVSLLTYAASRDVWDIDGLADSIALALVDADLVRDIADVFALTVDDIARVPYPGSASTSDGGVRRIGTATARKLVDGITAAKNRPLARHITALGVRRTGRTMGRRLATHFGSLEALRTATVEELATVEGIGPEKAQSIAEGLREQHDVIDRMILAGITTRVEGENDRFAAGALAGKRVVITGAIPGMNRVQAYEAAERLGAIVSGSVSAKTDLLIAGSGTSTGSKLSKAQDLGVKVMPAEEFVSLTSTE